ncbi:cation transporting ATPase C-terminal domain-containing protein [Streptomyces afghaniensis]|uniref:cation transporting ATPase C-terminal domain-containing protein n=1 Tax=Streptomyces afghaniensis TaxID=66865 RepID=UPI002785B506|nr:cation transporting ATPase C-terminal domain-containing protein [Streptomyces afghaniensis]MDQ1014378.1 magnesium-transporting ATPase (P-type) [Streptomyces afghaniensis]
MHQSQVCAAPPCLPRRCLYCGQARGRTVQAHHNQTNIEAVKFVRFQVSTALGFVTTFLVSSLTGLAGGAPFTALQILFVNLVMDGPPAMSLGVDPVSPDAMSKPPRPTGEPILSRKRLARILLTSAVMAAGTLTVLTWGPGPEAEPGQATVAGTMVLRSRTRRRTRARTMQPQPSRTQ